jgi:excisionase family DNA binding protein
MGIVVRDKPLIMIKEAVARTGLTAPVLYQAIEEGELPAYRDRAYVPYRIDPDELEAWIESKNSLNDPEIRQRHALFKIKGLILGAPGTFEDKLLAAIESLDERHRHVLVSRFGMFGKPRTLDDLSQELGLSRQRIHRLQKEALETVAENFGTSKKEER